MFLERMQFVSCIYFSSKLCVVFLLIVSDFAIIMFRCPSYCVITVIILSCIGQSRAREALNLNFPNLVPGGLGI